MTQGNYVSEDTNNLIRRAQQTLGGVPVLDLTNWQAPTYSLDGTVQIRSLAGSCHRVIVKNSVNGNTSTCPIPVDSSIVICTGPTLGTCASDPVPITCPANNTISTTQYVNMVAKFTMGAAQNGVKVTFKYLYNDVPTSTVVTINATVGDNVVYAFTTNQLYNPDDTLVLYGAEVLS